MNWNLSSMMAGAAPGALMRVLGYFTADFAKDTDKSVWLAHLAGIDVVINSVEISRESRGQSFSALHTETPRARFSACSHALPEQAGRWGFPALFAFLTVFLLDGG